MMQMLKLNEIQAEEELKVQRKREVTESYLPGKSLFLISFLSENKWSNDACEFLLIVLPCPELCGIVGQIDCEKQRYESKRNHAGFTFARVRKSVLFFSSKDFNNHNTTVGTV